MAWPLPPVPGRIGARHRIVAGAAPGMAPPEAPERQPAAAPQPVHLAKPRARIRSSSGGSGSSARSTARSSSGRAGSASRRARRPPAGSRVRRARCRARDPRKRGRQILQDQIERTCQDRRPRHDDVVIARLGRTRKDRARRRPQPAARPIARHRVADPPAGGEADADRRWLAPRPRLQHKRRCRPSAARRRHGDELARRFKRTTRTLCGAACAQTGPVAVWQRSAGQALAPLGTPPRDHAPAADRRHARAEPVPPLADEVARLIGALHDGSPCPLPNQSAVYRPRLPACQTRPGDGAAAAHLTWCADGVASTSRDPG